MQLQYSSPTPPPPDLWSMVISVIIVLITGFISVARRVLTEKQTNPLWIASEYASCLLFGYLAYEAYPVVKSSIPDFVTVNLFVSSGAYLGIRGFHIMEDLLTQRLGIQDKNPE